MRDDIVVVIHLAIQGFLNFSNGFELASPQQVFLNRPNDAFSVSVAFGIVVTSADVIQPQGLQKSSVCL